MMVFIRLFIKLLYTLEFRSNRDIDFKFLKKCTTIEYSFFERSNTFFKNGDKNDYLQNS